MNNIVGTSFKVTFARFCNFGSHVRDKGKRKRDPKKNAHSQISTSLFWITPPSQTLQTFYKFVLFLRENLFQS